ncbi:hypothetical protein FRC11_000239, partial [Ceratobasidium sp. 423]
SEDGEIRELSGAVSEGIVPRHEDTLWQGGNKDDENADDNDKGKDKVDEEEGRDRDEDTGGPTSNAEP